ncbi:MAG: fused MFS/spermidine synthase, partial [Alphaproteobacteria bacterium]
LQAWFARTGHPQAKNPYVLYAASNIGSFLALFAYPFIAEPLSTLPQQTGTWTLGFHILIGFIAMSGLILVRGLGAAAAVRDSDHALEAAPAPTLSRVLTWIGLAFVPSALLVAVTQHLSTDVAAAPFLWVLPLGLFLATFVVVFQDKPVISHRLMLAVQPILIVGLALSIAVPTLIGSIAAQIVLHLAAFFVTTMVCHGELAARRPIARQLTAFYLWMSFGGVLGGIFAGLAAPHLFNWVLEYPLLVVVAMLCRPGMSLEALKTDRIAHAMFGILVLALLPGALFNLAATQALSMTAYAIMGFALIAAIHWKEHPLRFALMLALALGAFRVYHIDTGDTVSVRSFFGVHRIVVTEDGRYRLLTHGTTYHGVERLTDAAGKPETGLPEPLSYYHKDGPLAGAIEATRERLGRPIRVGAVGLGSGSLACYRQPGDDWRFYEIDAEVARLARSHFSFLPRCAPDMPVVLGDARLTLADGPQAAYDVLVIDAFSSDSIPVHLLTREALAVYRKKLAPGGLLVMHISNRHMELGSVVGALAADAGMKARVMHYLSTPEKLAELRFASTTAVLAEKSDDFGALVPDLGWSDQGANGTRVWTDDYSNVLGAIKRHYWR